MQKAQLLELVLGTLSRLSGVAPVLFTVEDVHWADRSTLDLTAFLIRSLRNARVLVVVTYRSDELHRRHPLRPLLTSWERDRSIDRIDLRRFDRDEVGAQLHAILGEAPGLAVTETVFDRSGGNAYLVEELAGTVKARGDPADLPPSLADVLLSRVDALTPDAQKLLRTASVAGRAVPDRLLAEVAGLGENELYAALREAVENHLLVVAPDGQGYAFRHALTRDAVYEDMLPGERVRLHAAYGEALERDPGLAAGEAGQAGLATALAYHWYAALDLPRALPASIDAGQARDGLVRARPRRCATWNGRWRSGPGSPMRRSAPAWTGSRSAGGPAKPRTSQGRWTGPGRCSPTPWPSSPPTPTRSAGRCCSSGTRSSSGTRAPPAKRPNRYGRRWRCCPRVKRPERTRSCSRRWPTR